MHKYLPNNQIQQEITRVIDFIKGDPDFDFALTVTTATAPGNGNRKRKGEANSQKCLVDSFVSHALLNVRYEVAKT